jgi:hypothetical protein
MRHDLFKHFEIELFVPARHLLRAAAFLRQVLCVFAGTADCVTDDVRQALAELKLEEVLFQYRGSYTHHYPICFRRVLPDDTLISPASSPDEPTYAISLITYVEPREPFIALADFLGRSMAKLFDARPHWGKYCPLTAEETEALYPKLEEFRETCLRYDPSGVFRNEFVTHALGFREGGRLTEETEACSKGDRTTLSPTPKG